METKVLGQRIADLKKQLQDVREERKKFLKSRGGSSYVTAGNASAEAKYIKLKVLDSQIENLKEVIVELETEQKSR